MYTLDPTDLAIVLNVTRPGGEVNPGQNSTRFDFYQNATVQLGLSFIIRGRTTIQW